MEITKKGYQTKGGRDKAPNYLHLRVVKYLSTDIDRISSSDYLYHLHVNSAPFDVFLPWH